jgi:hypothetical protein
MNAAPDLDWSLEVCPVDDVARVVVDHVRRTPGVTTLHVEPARRRLWRGAVLWMALRGYDVTLMPYDQWCERLEAHANDPAAALRPLLPFFTWPVDGLGSLRLPRLYEESRRNRISSERSKLALQGQEPSALDARLLQKTFDNLVDCGYLPAAHAVAGHPEVDSSAPFFETLLRRHFDDADLTLLDATPISWGADAPGEHGIIGELASWRHGRAAGLSRVELNFVRGSGVKEQLTVVLKAQVPDSHTLDVGGEVARLCSVELGEAWQIHRARSEVCLSHLREAAIYALEEDVLARYMPGFYGASDGLLVMEDLTGMALLNSAEQVWDETQIAAAITGIGTIHAKWYGTPPTAPWLPPPRECTEQQSLWKALADVALEQSFAHSMGESGVARYSYLLGEVERWSAVEKAMPQTLIHNDFSPRNIAIRPDGRLCAYDWELARIGLPQRDLAEFLCFTLPPNVTEDTLTRWVEFHRDVLEQGTGKNIDKDAWRLGFGAAMADFMVTRLPLYAMISRFHPQPFLDRVVKTWARIDHHMGFDRGLQ